MAKQLLPHDLTAAERQSGCVWASRFRSAADEIDKGGVITGTPVFERTRGVTLDGATEYVTYGLNGQLSLLTYFAYHVVFYPAFAANDGVQHYIFDADSGIGATRTMLQKLNTNNLIAYFGNGTATVNLPVASYQALWVNGGRNVISVYATTTDNHLWLNGTEFTNATAWVPQTLGRLTVGASNAGTGRFAGRIESLHIFNRMDGFALEHAAIVAGGGA